MPSHKKIEIKSKADRTAYLNSIKPEYDKPTKDESLYFADTDESTSKKVEYQETTSTERRLPTFSEKLSEHFRTKWPGVLIAIIIIGVGYFIFNFTNEMSKNVGKLDSKVESIDKDVSANDDKIENLEDKIHDIDLLSNENKIRVENNKEKIDKLEKSNSKVK